ncbi:MAG: hypothetical protein WBD36_06595 [Bacteroidota bacterium]
MVSTKTKFLISVLFVAGSLWIGGCKKEENPATPPPAVEHPPATTVYFIVTEVGGSGVADTCIVRDTTQTPIKKYVDGTLNLVSGKTYNGKFVLFDESVNPREDLTNDIIDEKDAHVFKFTFNGGLDTNRVKITNLDTDSKGLPFGLNFKITIAGSGAASGNIHVILEHHDDGNKAGTEFDLDLDRDFPAALQ